MVQPLAQPDSLRFAVNLHEHEKSNLTTLLFIHYSRHLNTHTKEKPDKCPHCDHTAADKYNLQDHIARAHPSGPPTHICHICGKGFYVHADLKTHLSRHDGKFGRKCGTCGETFASWNDLQSHLVKVHGKDPFVCDEWYMTIFFQTIICMRMYNSSNFLHMKKRSFFYNTGRIKPPQENPCG